jgi:peptide/nickel transport system ATP-binding protein
MDTAATLAVRDLSIDYRSSRGLVRGAREVSFEVAPKEAIALIGESGSGKSTVALALMRLLPTNAEVRAGRIEFRDGPGDEALDVLRLSERDLRRFRWSACALVPQGAISALNPVMRVAEHFQDTALAHDYLQGAALEARAAELLGGVRLDPARVWRAYPHELSGGMRQRVLIALALLLGPRVLVLDEPTTALDILTQRSILDVLHELRRTSTFSLVFISHDLAVAAELCDRIVTMYAGRVVEVGPTRDVMAEPRHPYTIALLRAVPSLAGNDARVAAIPGSPPDLVNLPPGCPFAPRCPLASDVCRTDDPPLITVGPGHAAACHHWAEARTLLATEDLASA